MIKWRDPLDEEVDQKLDRAQRQLIALHRECNAKAELSLLVKLPAEQELFDQVADEIAELTSRVYLTQVSQYPGRSGDALAIMRDLGPTWFPKAFRTVGTVRGMGLLGVCRFGETPSLQAITKAAWDAHESLVSLDEVHRLNERRRAEAECLTSKAA